MRAASAGGANASSPGVAFCVAIEGVTGVARLAAEARLLCFSRHFSFSDLQSPPMGPTRHAPAATSDKRVYFSIFSMLVETWCGNHHFPSSSGPTVSPFSLKSIHSAASHTITSSSQVSQPLSLFLATLFCVFNTPISSFSKSVY